MQILLVEDEAKIGKFLKQALVEDGYNVELVHDGSVALDLVSVNDYDLAILDIMVPGASGIEVCREIRKTGKQYPVMMLTAKDAIEDKVIGLDAGADDYLTKPFSFSELSARVRALLRRNKKTDPVILKLDNLVLDPAKKVAKRAEKVLNLTPKEFGLLEYFLRNRDRVITKTELLEHVWDYNYDGLSNIVETYVKYLRKKLQQDPKNKDLIKTRRGSGYMMTAED